MFIIDPREWSCNYWVATIEGVIVLRNYLVHRTGQMLWK